MFLNPWKLSALWVAQQAVAWTDKPKCVSLSLPSFYCLVETNQLNTLTDASFLGARPLGYVSCLNSESANSGDGQNERIATARPFSCPYHRTRANVEWGHQIPEIAES